MDSEQGRTPRGVAYTVRGSGQPLLWMSGYVVPVSAFDRVVEELTDAFRVICVDHRGSGRSRTRLFPTTTGTMAADAVSVLDHLDVESAHVVGTSLGGMVAQEMAIAQPHRVRTLVLCSTTAGGPGAKTPPWRDLANELAQTGRRVPGQMKFNLLGSLHQAAAAASHDASRQLGEIVAPALVLHGGEDAVIPLENAEWLGGHIPGAHLVMIDKGTHLLLLESAEARAEMKRWLGEHASHEPTVVAASARARFIRFVVMPYRAVLGQTLPLRRGWRAGMKAFRVSV